MSEDRMHRKGYDLHTFDLKFVEDVDFWTAMAKLIEKVREMPPAGCVLVSDAFYGELTRRLRRVPEELAVDFMPSALREGYDMKWDWWRPTE